MKSNEIVVGSTYAMAPHENVDLYAMGSARLNPVTILAAPKAGKVSVRDETTRRDVVRVQSIIAPWSEYVQAVKDSRKFAANRKERTIAAAEAIKSFLPEGTSIPFGFDGTIYTDGSYSQEGKITVAELANLLSLAYAAGHDSFEEGDIV